MGFSGPVTYRQFTAWMAWLDMDKEVPSRADYYAMQTACEVRRVLSQKPNDISPNDFRIRFKDTPSSPVPSSSTASAVEATMWAKAAWAVRLQGIGPPPAEANGK